MTTTAAFQPRPTVPAPVPALAFELRAAANRLMLDAGGRSFTPHGLADARRQLTIMRGLLDELETELC